jgi:hypothetical protein
VNFAGELLGLLGLALTAGGISSSLHEDRAGPGLAAAGVVIVAWSGWVLLR